MEELMQLQIMIPGLQADLLVEHRGFFHCPVNVPPSSGPDPVLFVKIQLVILIISEMKKEQVPVC